MNEDIDVRCSVCREQKNTLYPRNSRILVGIKLILCAGCMRERYEPRHIVILGLRSGVIEASKYLESKKYLGNDISAKEVFCD